MAPLHKYKTEDIKRAFKVDCDNFLEEFTKLKSFKFQDFVKIWQKFKFSLVYTKVESDEELASFAELAFFTLKKIATSSQSVYIRIGAFYLLYGLYYKQPISTLRRIRLTISDYEAIEKLINDLKDQEINDPAYILGKMKYDDVFEYVYLDSTIAPDLKYYSQLFTKQGDDFEKSDCSSIKSALENIVESDLVELNEVDRVYRKSLQELQEMYSDISVQTFQTDPLKAVKALLEGGPSAEEAGPSEDMGKKRKTLKKRAMSHVKPGRKSAVKKSRIKK